MSKVRRQRPRRRRDQAAAVRRQYVPSDPTTSSAMMPPARRYSLAEPNAGSSDELPFSNSDIPRKGVEAAVSLHAH